MREEGEEVGRVWNKLERKIMELKEVRLQLLPFLKRNIILDILV